MPEATGAPGDRTARRIAAIALRERADIDVHRVRGDYAALNQQKSKRIHFFMNELLHLVSISVSGRSSVALSLDL